MPARSGHFVLLFYFENSSIALDPQVCGKSPEFWTTSGDKGEEIECFPVSLFQCVVIVGFHQVFSISLRGTLFLGPLFTTVGSASFHVDVSARIVSQSHCYVVLSRSREKQLRQAIA